MFTLDNEDPDYQLNNREDGASYKTVMYIIWLMHLLQFLTNTRILVLQDPIDKKLESEDDAFHRANSYLLGDSLGQEWSYRPMNRVFNGKYWWIWIIQSLAYVAVITLYFVKHGKENAFAIYIPVDCLLFFGMAVFYFANWKKSIIDQ